MTFICFGYCVPQMNNAKIRQNNRAFFFGLFANTQSDQLAPHLLSCKRSRPSMAEHCIYSKDSLVRVCGGAGGATQHILKDRGAMKLCRDSIVGPNHRVLAYARK